MAKSSDYRMAIKIAGEIEKSLYNSTDLTRKELNKIAREAAYTSSVTKDSFQQGLKETEPFFDGLEKAGVKAFKAVATAAAAAGTAIVGIGTMAAQAGIGFESAFAGVKKTTDATAEEYTQLREEILAMTREIPAAGEEIAGVAEAAGQLGIEKENLLSFTRTMIDLGESTNLSSEEAASSLAKFANITGMAADNYGRLGSVIVDLGNNFATTEADIVSMATNMASAGELAGFTEAQIMAMSTAMSSVGIEAEAGGSSMSKIIKKIQVAVETGNKSLKDYARVAGKSVEEFKEDFEKDGLTAVAEFIKGLNDVERNGKSATVILDEMGLTEVRLSNTLLSLANADDLLLNAVETANNAWDENIALTNEAAQRYETTESKIAVMKNGFTEMGIVMYDQFNEPLRDGIDIITELVHEATADISGSNVIHDLAQDIINGVPTAIGIIEETAEAVGNFAEPFLEVGGWMVDHPGVITGTIAGIGTTIATYKVVSGVMSLVTSLSALGPAGLAIMGIGAGVGGVAAVITGISTAVKKSAAEAKKASLDTHFGNIALSMKEIHQTASLIIGDRSLEQMKQSIQELGELDGIADDISRTSRELDRMDWKVSIGMELTEEENGDYRRQIEAFISDIQGYVEQDQYAITMSVTTLLGDDLENSNLVTQLNDFYAGKQQELADIGTELNKAVTDAFEDGLLKFDEVQKIAELKQQMSRIQSEMAGSDFEAGLDLLELKYGGNLTADSARELMTELVDQQAEAMEGFEQEYAAGMSRNRMLLREGEITQEEFDTNKADLDAALLQHDVESQQRIMQFYTNMIEETYGEEIGNLKNEIDQQLQGRLTEAVDAADYSALLNMAPEIMYDAMSGIDKADQDAIREFYEIMKPMMENAENTKQRAQNAEYITADTKKAINGLNDELYEADMIAAVSGDIDAMWSVIGETVNSSEELENIISAAKEEGIAIPDAVSTGIDEGHYKVREAMFSLSDATQLFINEAYGKEFIVPIHMQMGAPYADDYTAPASKYPDITYHEDGGFITRPTLSWLAEGGYPESVIPLDGSQNALNLWQQTGELLGVYNRKDGYHALASQLLDDSDTGSSMYNTVDNSEENNRFSYSPTYNFYGDAPSKKDLDEHIEDSFEKWEKMMNQWIRNNQRLSFR